MSLVLQPPLQTKQSVADAPQFHHWQEALHYQIISQSKQPNRKEQFALKIILKMPEILLTRKSSSQYTLPLTLQNAFPRSLLPVKTHRTIRILLFIPKQSCSGCRVKSTPPVPVCGVCSWPLSSLEAHPELGLKVRLLALSGLTKPGTKPCLRYQLNVNLSAGYGTQLITVPRKRAI